MASASTARLSAPSTSLNAAQLTMRSGAIAGNRPGHGARIGHVERRSRQRDHLAIGKCLDDERCELSVGTRDEDAIDRQDQ